MDRIYSDPVRIPEPDPDPNEHENQDPDPDLNKVGSDPQHCLRLLFFWLIDKNLLLLIQI